MPIWTYLILRFWQNPRRATKNVLSTLEGEMLLGDPDACITSGRIFIGTSPEIMDGA